MKSVPNSNPSCPTQADLVFGFVCYCSMGLYCVRVPRRETLLLAVDGIRDTKCANGHYYDVV